MDTHVRGCALATWHMLSCRSGNYNWQHYDELGDYEMEYEVYAHN